MNLNFSLVRGVNFAHAKEFRVSDGQIHQQDTIEQHKECYNCNAFTAGAPLRIKLVDFFVIYVLTIVKITLREILQKKNKYR